MIVAGVGRPSGTIAGPGAAPLAPALSAAKPTTHERQLAREQEHVLAMACSLSRPRTP
jgi:hypothetical protein